MGPSALATAWSMCSADTPRWAMRRARSSSGISRPSIPAVTLLTPPSFRPADLSGLGERPSRRLRSSHTCAPPVRRRPLGWCLVIVCLWGNMLAACQGYQLGLKFSVGGDAGCVGHGSGGAGGGGGGGGVSGPPTLLHLLLHLLHLPLLPCPSVPPKLWGQVKDNPTPTSPHSPPSLPSPHPLLHPRYR